MTNRGQTLNFCCILQSLPEDITRIVRSFADDLVSSLQESLKRVPQNLVLVKMKCKNINDTVFKNRQKSLKCISKYFSSLHF